VDGENIRDVKERFRMQSPDYGFTLPADNFFTAIGEGPFEAGTYFPAVDDGFYVMLAPWPIGRHTIHFHISVDHLVAVKAPSFNRVQQASISGPQTSQQETLGINRFPQISITLGIWFGTRKSVLQIDVWCVGRVGQFQRDLHFVCGAKATT
jgi:hypothetical protein